MIRDEIRYNPYRLFYDPQDYVASNLIVFHGYSELYVQGAWRKATSAFNAEICERFGVPPLTFDGSTDALPHPFTAGGAADIEYIRDRGVYTTTRGPTHPHTLAAG